MIRFTVFLLIASCFAQQVISFWFTDTSLFQAQPAQLAQVVKQQPLKSEQAPNPGSVGQVELLVKSNEPWLRVESVQAPTSRQQQQQEPVQLAQLQLQQQQCQCNTELLQNQTGAYLNKWLTSPNIASQMRLLLVSNSTGAISAAEPRRRDAHHGTSGNNSSSNHWATWIRSKGATNGPARAARNKPHGQQQLAQGERGPQGPKGEQGARGERGPSGLISVKDRDGLFDLASAAAATTTASLSPSTSTFTSSSAGSTGATAAAKSSDKQQAGASEQLQQQQQQQLPRLVFIEAEQMLVVGTDSGWRPVQLLAPLRDFRKAIAKFSLSSPEERRKLLSLGRNMDNSIKPLRRHEITATGSGGAGSIARAAAIVDDAAIRDGGQQQDKAPFLMAGSNSASAASVGNYDLDSADLDDDDEDDDEDEDDDDDDDELDEDDAIDENDISANLSNGRSSLTTDTNRDKPRRKPTVSGSSGNQASQVSGRSATAAALVSASIGSSLKALTSVKLQQQQQQMAESRRGHLYDSGAYKRMKLRMAALNEPFSGNAHGIRGADFECKRNAARANVKGSFRAFLAAGFQSLNEVVRYNVHKYPIVNLRGETLANSWHDLFKQPTRIANPLSRIYSFDGRHVATDPKWPNKLVWHGAANKAGYRDLVQNCDGWHSDSLSKFGLATPLHPPRNAGAGVKSRRQRKRYLVELAQVMSSTNNQTTLATTTEHSNSVAFLEGIEKYPCRMPLIVLCIETIGQPSDQWSHTTKQPILASLNNEIENNNLVSV